MRTLLKYKLLKRLSYFVLIAYFAGGIWAERLPGHEVYPVFSWFLFTHVPAESLWFTIVIHKVDGQAVDPPVDYQDAAAIVPDPHSVTANYVIQRLGRDIVYRHGRGVERIRELLERDYLPRNTEYDLVRVKYHPIRSWKNGQVQRRVLRHYSSAQGEL